MLVAKYVQKFVHMMQSHLKIKKQLSTMINVLDAEDVLAFAYMMQLHQLLMNHAIS